MIQNYAPQVDVDEDQATDTPLADPARGRLFARPGRYQQLSSLRAISSLATDGN